MEIIKRIDTISNTLIGKEVLLQTTVSKVYDGNELLLQIGVGLSSHFICVKNAPLYISESIPDEEYAKKVESFKYVQGLELNNQALNEENTKLEKELAQRETEVNKLFTDNEIKLEEIDRLKVELAKYQPKKKTVWVNVYQNDRGDIITGAQYPEEILALNADKTLGKYIKTISLEIEE